MKEEGLLSGAPFIWLPEQPIKPGSFRSRLMQAELILKAYQAGFEVDADAYKHLESFITATIRTKYAHALDRLRLEAEEISEDIIPQLRKSYDSPGGSRSFSAYIKKAAGSAIIAEWHKHHLEEPFEELFKEPFRIQLPEKSKQNQSEEDFQTYNIRQIPSTSEVRREGGPLTIFEAVENNRRIGVNMSALYRAIKSRELRTIGKDPYRLDPKELKRWLAVWKQSKVLTNQARKVGNERGITMNSAYRYLSRLKKRSVQQS